MEFTHHFYLLYQGRFRDTYKEIIALVESEELLPPKRLGAVVCVAMMDSSTHAKSRASACETCLACVKKAGLAGIGKKGVMSAVKLLSQESTKYRGAALDLVEVILSKMNGDMQRLARICGPNLSDKARQLVEERVSQGRPARGASPSYTGTPAHARSPTASPVKSHARSDSQGRNVTQHSDLYNELPKLSLRSWKKGAQKSSDQMREATADASEDRFAFSLSAFKDASPSKAADFEPVTEQATVGETAPATRPDMEPSGAAAALRARLLKIRERSVVADGVADGGSVDGTTLNAANFDAHLGTIRRLLGKQAPVLDQDADLAMCINSLKIFHAALSRQQHSAIGLSVAELADVRTSLVNNMDTVVEFLRRYGCDVPSKESCVGSSALSWIFSDLTTHLLIGRLIIFAFNSGEETVNAGILLPLLSLCLATLMALFRDAEFALVVSTEELTLLLRETGVALLDSRLSSSDKLNEETGSQMVRAINKVSRNRG